MNKYETIEINKLKNNLKYAIKKCIIKDGPILQIELTEIMKKFFKNEKLLSEKEYEKIDKIFSGN